MDQPFKRPSTTAIKLDDVHVTLPSRAGPVHILRGVDLNIAEGEAIAVVGPNGAGKTVLFRAAPASRLC